MFKKKEKQPIVNHDYKNWEDDFGFLNLISSRKKKIIKEYVINIYSKQKSENDYLTDEEIEPIIDNCIKEILSQLGQEYKDYLIKHYFGNERNLISFISEDVYTDLVTDSININVVKMRKHLQKKSVDWLLK